jgi:hypothetical protein
MGLTVFDQATAKCPPRRPGNGAGRVGRAASLSWTGAPPVLPPIEECVELGPGAVGPGGWSRRAGRSPGWGAADSRRFR